MTQEQELQDNKKTGAPEGADEASKPRTELVRLIKAIAVNPVKGTRLDDSVIKFKYYNAFNYSLLSRDAHETMPLTLGVISPKPKEGKTLVACNLAVSLAMSSQKRTVLVDCNPLHARLHDIFGVPMTPGLSEALVNGTIHVTETSVQNLAILTAGNFPKLSGMVTGVSAKGEPEAHKVQQAMFGLEHLPALRDVIYSLEQEFDFVIVDLPAINTDEVPVLFTSQMNGLLVVVNSGKTRRDDLDEMFRHVNESKVLGFVFNRFNSQDL